MPYKKSKNCPICEKPIAWVSFYCRKHAPFSKIHKKHISDKTKGKPKLWLRGKKRPEHSKFLKNWWIEHPKEREKAKQRGKKYTKNSEWIKKVSNFGEKNPSWRGGLSKLRPKLYQYSKKWLKLRNKILEECDYKCCVCGGKFKKKDLQIHHKFPFSVFPELVWNEKFLIPVCKKCHWKLTGIGHKTIWIK